MSKADLLYHAEQLQLRKLKNQEAYRSHTRPQGIQSSQIIALLDYLIELGVVQIPPVDCGDEHSSDYVFGVEEGEDKHFGGHVSNFPSDFGEGDDG